jgi:hypothetical protein
MPIGFKETLHNSRVSLLEKTSAVFLFMWLDFFKIHSIKFSANKAYLGFYLCRRKTRKTIFLGEMDRVVPWARLATKGDPPAMPGRQ